MATEFVRYRILVLTAFATLVDGYDIQSLGLAVPLMAREHGVAPASFGPALTATIGGMVVGALALAPLGDMLGRLRSLALAMLVVAAGSMLTAASDLGLPLVLSRLVVGIGIGGAVPAAVSLATEMAPPQRRSVLVTAVVVATGVGSFAAGVIAPIVTAELGGWRAIFLLGGVLPALCSASLWMLRHESAADNRPIKVSTRTSPVALLAQANRRVTLALWGLMAISLAVTYALVTWLPTLLVGAGWSIGSAQRATGLLAIGGIVGGLALGWAADRWPFRSALAGAYLLAMVAFAATAVVPAAGWMPVLLIVGCTAFGAVMILGAGTPLFYPHAIRSTATGWASGVGRIGALAGPVLVTAALGADVASGAIMAALAVPALACVALAMLLPRQFD